MLISAAQHVHVGLMAAVGAQHFTVADSLDIAQHVVLFMMEHGRTHRDAGRTPSQIVARTARALALAPPSAPLKGMHLGLFRKHSVEPFRVSHPASLGTLRLPEPGPVTLFYSQTRNKVAQVSNPIENPEVWWARRDSNPHVSLRWNLNQAHLTDLNL